MKTPSGPHNKNLSHVKSLVRTRPPVDKREGKQTFFPPILQSAWRTASGRIFTFGHHSISLETIYGRQYGFPRETNSRAAIPCPIDS